MEAPDMRGCGPMMAALVVFAVIGAVASLTFLVWIVTHISVSWAGV
jgi:hypothetical protein